MLVGHGFPFDVVECWDEAERMAQVIIIGELNGREWNWDRMRWEKPKAD